MAIIIYHYYICVLVDLLKHNRTVRRCYTGRFRTALNLGCLVAYLAFFCPRFRASHPPGGETFPEIQFGLLRGWQNLAGNQGIKMQGLQNLPSNSI